MNDLYTILRQSLVDRDLRAAAERDEAYAQARTAMIRRLWSFDPPLAEDEIDARIGQFDLAVDRIESDLVAIFAAGTARAPGRSSAMTVVDDLDTGYDSGFPGDKDPPDPNDPAAMRAAARRELDERSRIVEAALQGLEIDPPIPAIARTPSREMRRPEPEPEDESYDRDSGIEAYRGGDRRDDTDRYSEEDERDRDDRRGDNDFDPYPEEPGRGGVSLLDTPYEDEPEEPAPRQRAMAPRSRMRAPQWRPSRIQVLAGLVGVLAIGLVAITAYLVLPSLISGDGPGTVTAGGGPAVIGAGGVSAPAVTIFDGQDPTVFQTDSNNPIRYSGEGSGGFAGISTSAGSAGASAVIGPGLSDRLAGRSVRVTLRARASRENGAASLRFAYQSGVAISHWQVAKLSESFADYTLDWRVPSLRTDPAGDHIVIEPGIPGDGSSVDVSSIRIEVVGG
jgi:hypothetical protein